MVDFDKEEEEVIDLVAGERIVGYCERNFVIYDFI